MSGGLRSPARSERLLRSLSCSSESILQTQPRSTSQPGAGELSSPLLPARPPLTPAAALPFPPAETVRAMTHVINQGMAMYWGTSRWSSMEIMVGARGAGAATAEQLQ